VRGAIGTLAGHRSQDVSRSVVVNAIAHAVNNLNQDELSKFGNWVDGFAARAAPVRPVARVREYRALWQTSVPEESITNLPNNISWTFSYLAKHQQTISEYVQQLCAFETAVFQGDWDGALAVLNAIDEQLGLSKWAGSSKSICKLNTYNTAK
jgi:hypothetical protein